MKGPDEGRGGRACQTAVRQGRYLGLSEPGIIAAEPPNPMVSNLVVMPDIEKRLEAFVRLGHGILVFPGGVGTAEEILYLLGILLEPENRHIALPLVFTGPSNSKAYFEELDAFLRLTFGDEIASRYRIIIDDSAEVGRVLGRAIRERATTAPARRRCLLLQLAARRAAGSSDAFRSEPRERGRSHAEPRSAGCTSWR